MARETESTPDNTSYTKGLKESRHSHFEYGSTHGQWNRDPSSDFAITSVNVPDRLDTQEVRARAAAESDQPAVRRFHRDDVLRAVRWLLILGFLGAVAWWAMSFLMPLRAVISPAGVSTHVGRAIGVPVSVADTELRLLPSPRLLITDLTAQSGFRLPLITVYFNWRDAVQGLRAATLALGEARVAPVELAGPDAAALLRALQGASNLPASVSTIRFDSVSFPDIVFLPGRYQAVIRRDPDQRAFSAISLRHLDGGDGQIEVEITPPATSDGNARFALFARKWPAVVGPSIVWSEATAHGEFRADLLKVDSLSVGAVFGNISGTGMLARDGQRWRLSGNLRGADLSIEELTRHAAGAGEGEAALARIPLRGKAKFDLLLLGAGATVQETMRRATAAGPATVTGATFNGVNLGLMATQGGVGGAGGTTRLSDLDFDVVATQDGVLIRNIVGRAGGLRVSGGVSVDRKLQLSGDLRSEVSSPRNVVGANVRIGGTASAPTFQ